MNGKVITFVSGKGGTGKTLISATLGQMLAEKNYKVLLIDWDFTTRGLTSYLLPREEIPTKGILDIILEDIDILKLKPYNLDKNFDLIPSISSIRDPIEFSNIVKLHQMIGPLKLEKLGVLLNKLLDNFRNLYDYIFVDTRSGIEVLSIFPLFFSDWYIIICQEDRTSWRISQILEAAIKKYTRQVYITNRIYIPISKGFIVNESVINFTNDMIRFLERNVFERKKCLAVIPFEEKIRRVFAEDKSVAKECQDTEFYKKLRIIAYDYLDAIRLYEPITLAKTFSERVIQYIPLIGILYIIIFILMAKFFKLFPMSDITVMLSAISIILSLISFFLLYRSRLQTSS